jgi:hypothetical protein
MITESELPPTRSIWPVVVAAIPLTLLVTELVLGAIKDHWGEVNDRLYVVVFAAASVSSLVLSFCASEFVRHLRDGRKERQRISSFDE